MRVISGVRKGFRLESVKGAGVRPTADGTKELIFNVLPGVSGSWVLDLYAGTGSLGIEALSRGAAKAIFVEKQRKVEQVLRRNLQKTGLADQAEVFCAQVAKTLARLAGGGGKFDLILADPPYLQGLAAETLRLVVHSGVLSPEGWVVLEHSSREELGPSPGISLKATKRRGDSQVSFFTNGN